MKKIVVMALILALLMSFAGCGAKTETTPTDAPVSVATHIPSSEYKFDAGKQNPNGDFYPEAEKEFASKIDEILVYATDTQNSVFENALGLYEYITRNIIYKEDGADNTKDAVLSSSANKTGFTRLYQYLLNQVGSETHIATSDDGLQSWVMLKMPDGFYHFDPAEEAYISQGQSLLYFAMNDELRWGGGKINGWHLGSDELGGKYEAPKSKQQTYTYLQNVRCGYGIDTANNFLYYADWSQNNEIIKYNYEMMEEDYFFVQPVGALAYHNGELYYSDSNQRNQLFKVNLTSFDVVLLDNVFVTRMLVKKDKLIYFDDISSQEKALEFNQ